ncbi:MAG: response regulator [Gemmatimonadaceae bacterium]|nr:response regulator [Gemmatimonadaceae bacterium]
MPAPKDLTDVLAQLRERYLASSAPTIRAFDDLAAQLERTPDAAEVVQALRRELHRVRGTAGSYGFHETSRLAAALEPVAVRWTTDPQLDRGRRGSIVRRFVSALRGSLQPDGAPSLPGSASRGGIVLVELPDGVEARLTAEAMHRGHRVEVAKASDVASILAQRSDTAVVSVASAAPDVPLDVTWVVLREGEEAVPSPRERMTVVDLGADARDVISVLETRAHASPLAGSTVLLIEDDEHMAELLRMLGERQGMFVEARGNASGIRQLIDDLRPSLVLLDINLPGADGFAVTRDLRSDERYRELPIIMMSAATDVETRTAAFAAGADDFQSKPVSPEEIMRRIERVLESHRQRLIARGVHPVTGLLLPDRARHVLGATVSAQAARAEPVTVALLRPRAPVDGLGVSAAWHRELRLLAGALGSDGVRLGFRDEVAAMAVFGMPADEVFGRLDVLGEAAAQDLVPWCAGIAELRAGAEPDILALMRLADEAWQLARERELYAHVWDATDAGVAPDVVVVEDDDALADLVSFALSARGLTWVRYADGPAALAGLTAMRVQGRSPIVLLDVDLPGLDGFSVFERLRVERPGVFRVVFASVHATEADQLRAIRAGALDYLVKPLSLRVLLAKIVGWRAGAMTQ